MHVRARFRTLWSYTGLRSRKEFLGFFAVCLVALFLSNFSTVYHWLETRPGDYYLGYGSVINSRDINAYLMRIEQGRQGSWLFEEWYTPENVPKSAFYGLYMGVGHIARVFDLDARVAFHLARFAVLPVLLFGLYALLSLFVKQVRRKLSYFALFLLSYGFSFAFFPWFSSSETVSEASTFLTMMYAPHFILGLGLLVWFYWLLVRVMRQGSVGRRGLFAFLVLFILQGLVYPFALVIMYGIILSFWLLYWLKHSDTALIRATGRLLIVFVPGAVFAAYYAFVTLGQAFYRNWWLEQQFYGALNPLQFMIGYGICGVLAWIMAVRTVRSTEASETGLIVMTAGFFVSFFAYFIPVMYGTRFVIGFQIPLMILAMCWLEALHRRAGSWKLFVTVLLLAAVTSTCYQVYNDTWQMYAGTRVYITESVYGALVWLREHEPSPKIVLSGRFLGNYIPAVARQKTVYGSDSETYRSAVKKEQVEQFYAFPDTPGIQQKLLEMYTVSYVLLSPREYRPGGFDPEDAPYLRLVYDQPPVQLYQVI